MKNTYTTIEESNNRLVLAATDSIKNIPCKLTIDFVRTLRIPDDNKQYNLPPGLGSFPLKHVEDYQNVPNNWKEHGGVFLPMHQSEAMWLKFNSTWPFAIKVAAGKINAVSGESWFPELQTEHSTSSVAHDMLAREPKAQEQYMQDFHMLQNSLPAQHKKHDYMVSPKQPWLDGFNVGKGLIRQFVAMPLGEGYTVEEQLTGKAEHGGIQIIVYPMKPEYFQRILEEKERLMGLQMGQEEFASAGGAFTAQISASCATKSRGILRSTEKAVDMGLGAGGFMKQEIYDDPYGIDAWDTTKPMKIFIHLMNSNQYQHVTGESPPTKPLTPIEYQQYNYPWFDYYSDGKVLEGSEQLAKVDSIASMGNKKQQNPLGDNSSIPQKDPVVLGIKNIKNGKW